MALRTTAASDSTECSGQSPSFQCSDALERFPALHILYFSATNPWTDAQRLGNELAALSDASCHECHHAFHHEFPVAERTTAWVIDLSGLGHVNEVQTTFDVVSIEAEELSCNVSVAADEKNRHDSHSR